VAGLTDAPSPTAKVRIGGAALLAGSVQFVLAMAITQLGWTTPYSLRTNYISDLGAAHCGFWTGTDPRYICSPWHLVFDSSIVVLGVLTILGAYLIRRAMPPGGLATFGLALLAISGLGAIGVGLSPEDVNLAVHSASALTAFLAGNTALLLLGVAMLRDSKWGSGFATFGLILGAIGWAALILFVSRHYLGLGPGGMERLVVAPSLLWASVVGAKLVRSRRVDGADEMTAALTHTV
jgi:hypothetical membrane protein